MGILASAKCFDLTYPPRSRNVGSWSPYDSTAAAQCCLCYQRAELANFEKDRLLGGARRWPGPGAGAPGRLVDAEPHKESHLALPPGESPVELAVS